MIKLRTFIPEIKIIPNDGKPRNNEELLRLIQNNFMQFLELLKSNDQVKSRIHDDISKIKPTNHPGDEIIGLNEYTNDIELVVVDSYIRQLLYFSCENREEEEDMLNSKNCDGIIRFKGAKIYWNYLVN